MLNENEDTAIEIVIKKACDKKDVTLIFDKSNNELRIKFVHNLGEAVVEPQNLFVLTGDSTLSLKYYTGPNEWHS